MADTHVPDPEIPDLVPLRQAAPLLGISRSYVRTRMSSAGAEPVTVGRRMVVYRRKDVLAVAAGAWLNEFVTLPEMDSPSSAAERLGVDFHQVDDPARSGLIPCALIPDAAGRGCVAIRRAVVDVLIALVNGEHDPDGLGEIAAEHHALLRSAATRIARHRR